MVALRCSTFILRLASSRYDSLEVLRSIIRSTSTTQGLIAALKDEGNDSGYKMTAIVQIVTTCPMGAFPAPGGEGAFSCPGFTAAELAGPGLSPAALADALAALCLSWSSLRSAFVILGLGFITRPCSSILEGYVNSAVDSESSQMHDQGRQPLHVSEDCAMREAKVLFGDSS